MTPGRARSGRDPACSPIFMHIEQVLVVQSVDIPCVIGLSGWCFTPIRACNLIEPLARIEDERNHDCCAIDLHIDNDNSLLRVLNARFRVDCP